MSFKLFLQVARRPCLPIQASCSGPMLIVSSRRWIYNPTLSAPPAAGDSRLETQYHKSSVPSLSTESFWDIVKPTSEYDNLYTDPNSKPLSQKSPEEIWSNKSPKKSVLPSPPDQFAGRSVFVDGSDVGTAWNRLQGVLKLNKIRQELRLTARHEKKGVKRRRLRSEMWRRKFAAEVKKKVTLVNEIRLRDRMWGAGRH